MLKLLPRFLPKFLLPKNFKGKLILRKSCKVLFCASTATLLCLLLNLNQSNQAIADQNSAFDSSSQASTYLIEDVASAATAKTAVIARNNALNKARRQAFAMLLQRLELDSLIADQIDDSEIGYLIRSERINDEKITDTTYSAKLTVVFAKNFVDHFLKELAASKEEESKTTPISDPNATIIKKNLGRSALLIPAQIENNILMIWEEKNNWRSFVNLAVKKNEAQQFQMPRGEIDEIPMLNDQNLRKLSFQKLEGLLKRYRSDLACILIFSYNQQNNKALIEVSLFGRYESKNFRLAYYNNNGFSVDEIKKIMAEKTIAYLSGKLVLAKNDDVSGATQIEVRLKNIGDFERLKSIIQNSNLAQDFKILSISKNSAEISFIYLGKGEITDSFDPYGLNISNDQNGGYIAEIK